MTIEEVEILKLAEVRDAIENNLERDPIRIALDKSVPYAALVASQVKYLQRARRKLPEYYDARAILTPLSFEQSSSGATAETKRYSGGLCIDLTCGLGVDSFYLSRRFERVISVERDEVVAAVVRENFARLGVHNIDVLNLSAEEFLERAVSEGNRADMIYVDPDRRGSGGRKLVRLEDCSPDVVSLMERMRVVADSVVIKVSPMFDVAEAYKLFGPHCGVEVVSVGGECKEVVIEVSDDIANSVIKAAVAGRGEFEADYDDSRRMTAAKFDMPYKYLIVPDVALRKARLTGLYFGQKLPKSYLCGADGYVLANNLPDTDNILGRVFEIECMEEYAPKKQSRRLAEQGVKRADLYLNAFPFPAAAAARALGVKEGGKRKIALTETAGKLWYIEFKEISLCE